MLTWRTAGSFKWLTAASPTGVSLTILLPTLVRFDTASLI
jgi:hypothetical protein